MVFAGGLVISAFLVGLGVANTSAPPSDVWFEVTKAGFQLFAIILVGGAIAWAFRRLDELREDRRRKDEYLATVANDLWKAYLGVKAVRRALRAAGFGPTASSAITEVQSEEFRKQMDLLADARGTLERLVADVQTQPSLYQPIAEPIRLQLDAAEGYVAGVMKNWEYEAQKVKVGGTIDEDEDLKEFRRFLDHAHVAGGLKQRLSGRVNNAALMIQALRFERSRELLATATKVSESDSEVSAKASTDPRSAPQIGFPES